MKRRWKVLIVFGAVFVIYLIVLSTGASVISNSMGHIATVEPRAIDTRPMICGTVVEHEGRLSFDEWWNTCGAWYENHSITKEEFSVFSFSDGIRKGDFVWYSRNAEPVEGDVVVSKTLADRLLIHRVIETTERGMYLMKMDANADSLAISAGPSGGMIIDERRVSEEQIVGVVTHRIPLIGYPRAWLSDLTGR